MLSPPGPVEWETSSAGFAVSATMLVACPVGADGVGVQYFVEPSTTWLDTSPIACADTQIVVAEQPEGALVHVHIRWTLLSVPVSDWSVEKVQEVFL